MVISRYNFLSTNSQTTTTLSDDWNVAGVVVGDKMWTCLVYLLWRANEGDEERGRSKGGFWRAAEMVLDRVTEMAHVTTLKAHSYGKVGSFGSSLVYLIVELDKQIYGELGTNRVRTVDRGI